MEVNSKKSFEENPYYFNSVNSTLSSAFNVSKGCLGKLQTLVSLIFPCFGERVKSNAPLREYMTIEKLQATLGNSERSEKDKLNNLKGIQNPFPKATANDFYLSCSLEQTHKFHALFANTLFKRESYNKVKDFMESAANDLCDRVADVEWVSDLHLQFRIYLVKITLKLLCSEVDESECNQVISDLSEVMLKLAYNNYKPNNEEKKEKIRTYISTCFETLINLEDSFVFKMHEAGYSDCAIQITLLDLFDTVQSPLLTLLANTVSHLENVDYQNKVREDLNVQDTNLLDRVLIESLRLTPPIPTFGPNKVSVKLLGQQPKLTGYNQEDPSKFDPDAITNVPKLPRKLPFAPFGLGPNACPFSKFAMDAAKASIRALYTKYHIEIEKDSRSPQEQMLYQIDPRISLKLVEESRLSMD